MAESHIENFKSYPINTVQADQRRREPPSMERWEKIGIASSRMVEQKAQGRSVFSPGRCFWQKLPHGPDYQSKEDRVAGITC